MHERGTEDKTKRRFDRVFTSRVSSLHAPQKRGNLRYYAKANELFHTAHETLQRLVQIDVPQAQTKHVLEKWV